MLIVYTIIYAFVIGILSYGMAACIMALRRNETVNFGTIFSKIRENFGKLVKVELRVALDVVCLVLMYIAMMVIYAIIMAARSSSIMAIIAFLFIIGTFIFMIYYIYRLMIICFGMMFANYIIYMHPDTSSKDIWKKSKQIVESRLGKYITAILSNIGWIALTMIAIMLISWLEYLIWDPYISLFAGLTSTAPAWWGHVETLLITLISAVLFVKILSITAAFIESLNIENIFDDDYEIPKDDSKYIWSSLGLIVFWIVATIALAYIMTIIFIQII